VLASTTHDAMFCPPLSQSVEERASHFVDAGANAVADGDVNQLDVRAYGNQSLLRLSVESTSRSMISGRSLFVSGSTIRSRGNRKCPSLVTRL
jgi:hypothetical protein